MRFYALLLFGCLCLTAQAIRKLDGSTIATQEAEAYARKVLTEANVTGAQIAIVNNGRLVWSMAHGLRQLNPGLPMTKETTTWAASITKGVFATYVMQLVERGEFNLDTPVAKQLKRPLNQYPVYSESAADLVDDPNWQLVTPRMALNHTSGFVNLVFFAPDKKLHLQFKPGARYSYSGEALNLLQFLIEEQKGRPLDQLMYDSIFAPLEMTHTAVAFRPEFEANIADRFNDKGAFLAKTRRNARAAGSMTTSAEDMAVFAQALFENKILKPSTRKALFHPSIQIRTKRQFPSEDLTEGTQAKEVGLAYGMGWGLLTKTKFGKAFFKEGHGDGAQTFMICFERQKSCMIILTNSDNGELTYRSLLETLFGNTVTPWEWHGYPAHLSAPVARPESRD
jgi:CubicO group peptidase (beta-lactamase class C family)